MHKKRVLTSAPALSLVAIVFAGAAWGVERQMRGNHDSFVAVALSSEDGMEFDSDIISALPEEVTAALVDHVMATPPGQYDLEVLGAQAEFLAASEEYKRAIVAYVGRVLSARNRFDEALPILRSLSPEDRGRFEAGFAYAETLKNADLIDDALTAYQVHVAYSPNHQAGHINYAILLMRLGYYDRALPVLERAIEITSGRRKGKSYALLGMLHMAQERYARAEQAFQSSIEFRPAHAPTWRRLATARARAGSVSQQDVLATFDRAAALSPGNGRIEQSLAEFYFSVGRFDDALAPFRSATRHAPDAVDVLMNRTINLLVSERPAAARNVLRDLESLPLERLERQQVRLLADILSGSTSALRRRLGSLESGAALTDRELFLHILACLELGELAEAERLAAVMQSGSGYYQPSQFQLAKYLYRESRAAEALPRLTALVANNEQSAIFWLYLGRSHSDPQAALEAHRRARELLPRSGRMTIEYAEALNNVGQFEAASDILSGYLDTYPNETRALRALAAIFDANDRLEQAEQIYRIVYDLNTDDIAVGRDLADVQFRARRFGPALATLDSLIELQPSLVSVRLLRVQTLIRLDRVADARDELDLIVRLDSENETARSMLAELSGSF